jgi:hypothetical protein
MFIRYLLIHACKWLVVCPSIKLHESLPPQEANHLAKSHTPPGRARLVMAINVHRGPASRAMGSIRQPTDPSPSSAIKRTGLAPPEIIGAAHRTAGTRRRLWKNPWFATGEETSLPSIIKFAGVILKASSAWSGRLRQCSLFRGLWRCAVDSSWSLLALCLVEF